MQPAHEHNRRAWDERARLRRRHTRTASDRALANPLPAVDPEGWMGELRGRRVLCLAAGGGMQGVLFAAAGAVVTVVDISPGMLDLDRKIAAERGLKVAVVEASMDNLSALPEAGFDLVIQPVSTCYVPDVLAVYREAARVTAPGGLYISQHKQPVNLQAAALPSGNGYRLGEPYYRTGPLPPLVGEWRHRETDAVEYLHRWEDLLGGLCRCGFVIEDVTEPRHGDPAADPGTFEHRSHYVPPYVRIKARRVGGERPAPRLWTP